MAHTVAEPVQQPMPPTNCPKLRRMRDMIATEEEAKVQDDRAQRQEAAIQKWRAAPAEGGNRAFFQFGADLRQRGSEHGGYRERFGRKLPMPGTRRSAATRSSTSCGRYADRRDE